MCLLFKLWEDDDIQMFNLPTHQMYLLIWTVWFPVMISVRSHYTSTNPDIVQCPQIFCHCNIVRLSVTIQVVASSRDRCGFSRGHLSGAMWYSDAKKSRVKEIQMTPILNAIYLASMHTFSKNRNHSLLWGYDHFLCFRIPVEFGP